VPAAGADSSTLKPIARNVPLRQFIIPLTASVSRSGSAELLMVMFGFRRIRGSMLTSVLHRHDLLVNLIG
jgi:hypothetical protein